MILQLKKTFNESHCPLLEIHTYEIAGISGIPRIRLTLQFSSFLFIQNFLCKISCQFIEQAFSNAKNSLLPRFSNRPGSRRRTFLL